MAIAVEMPKMSDTMEEGVLVAWLADEGQAVSAGDVIAQVETDKATMDLEVYDDGVLLKRVVAEGSAVPIGALIAVLGSAGESADAVLALRPSFIDQDVGVAGPHPEGSPEAIEVRAFFPKDGVLVEDPVTGSLNASLAGWLLGTGRLAAPYVARQGTRLGREGRVHVTQDPEGAVWVAGATHTCIEGSASL